MNLKYCILVTFLCMTLYGEKIYPSLDLPLQAIDAPEWDSIFIRTSDSGWYSGDGIFSVPFNGKDTQGQKGLTKTFWLFSDSRYCKSIDSNTYKVSGGAMVNHSVAVLDPINRDPQFSDMTFHWGLNDSHTGGANTDGNIFGARAWAMDGLILNDTISMFMLEKDDETDPDNVTGVNMVHIPVVNSELDLTYSPEILDSTPFYIPNDFNGDMRLGSAVMDNTIEGGAHSTQSADGYIYVFGVRKINSSRGAIVSRVPKNEFRNFDAYQFWNGSSWTSSVSDLDSDDAHIFDQVSSDRYSVSQIRTGHFAGKYMAIYSRKLQHPIIEYKVADNITGPWSDGVPIWGMQEELDLYGLKETNIYGAKAHPHLSEPGELLISYCVNIKQSADERDHNKNRGRFIRLLLDQWSETPPQFLVSSTNKNCDASGYSTEAHTPSKAFSLNNQDVSKWQDISAGDKWISVDLGQPYYVDRWQLVNEGYLSGNSTLNTRDFKLQQSDDNITWTTIDDVTDNPNDIYDNEIPITQARYWRVYITKPSQNSSDTANILNINLYGYTNQSNSVGALAKHEQSHRKSINFTVSQNRITIHTPKPLHNIKMWTTTGRIIFNESTTESIIDLPKVAPNIYFLGINDITTKLLIE